MQCVQVSSVLLLSSVGVLSNQWQVNNVFSSYNSPTNKDSLASTSSELVVPSFELALTNCQEQFKWDRWNCPASDFLSKRSSQYLDRESAFMKAISMASIVYTVARNCSRGEIAECTCRRTNRVGRTRAGFNCSDNVAYGERVARRIFAESKPGTFDAQGYADLHNKRAGQIAVRRALRHRCHCIDPVEGCRQQICSKLLKPFNEIAADIRQMYDRALLLTTDNSGAIDTGDVSNSVLVYTLESPNYCQSNAIPDWPGIRGRMCSRTNDKLRTLAERRSCRNLCRTCGLRVRAESFQSRTRCNCRFAWCCDVKCDVCEKTEIRHFCD